MSLTKRNDKLGKWVTHIQNQMQRDTSQLGSQSVREKGIIRIRTCIRELVSNSAPVDHVWGMIQSVAKALRIELTGGISTHSVARFVGEGGVAAKLRPVDEFGNVKCTTYTFLMSRDLLMMNASRYNCQWRWFIAQTP